MKTSVKLFAAMLLMFLGFFSQAHAQVDAAQVAEKRVVAQWVVKNAHKGVTLQEIKQIVDHAYRHAKARQIDPLLIIATMRQESRFKATAKGGSSMGLMQVLPRWHRDKIASRNILNPDVNIEVGSEIMRECLAKNKGALSPAIRCYTGGAPPTYLRNIQLYLAELKKELQSKHMDMLVEYLHEQPMKKI